MTAIEIVNSALAMMGVNPIMAFTDNTKTAQIVNQIYPQVVNYCLSLHNWNFALDRVKLPKLSNNPNSDKWKYAYQEPANVLKIESVRDGNDDFVEYEEIGNVIYTNADTVYLRFVKYVDESYYPPYFIEVVKYKLASELALPIVGNAELYKAYLTMFNNALQSARGLDSQRGKMKLKYNSNWLEGLQ